MFDRTRQIRFRKRKKPKAWVFIIFLALALIGLKIFWFKPAGPAMTHNLAPATPAPVATAAGDPAEPLPIAEVSVRPLLEKILGVWGEALASGDFTQFHRLLSAGWRANDDPKTLALAYQSLYPYRELMETFPRRGKLVVIESRPLNAPANSQKALRDTLGPESPWLVRVEWRSGRAALGFNINFVWEDRQWRPVGLTAQAYRLDLRSGR